MPSCDAKHQAPGDARYARLHARRTLSPGRVRLRLSLDCRARIAGSLVCRAGNLRYIFCQGVEDLFGGLGPGEWPRVGVPVLDPVTDVGFEGPHALVHAAADHLIGQEAEPPLDLVDPGRAGRRAVQAEPGVAGQPRPDLRGLAGGEVVA